MVGRSVVGVLFGVFLSLRKKDNGVSPGGEVVSVVVGASCVFFSFPRALYKLAC